MLILSRKVGESIVIDGGIVVTMVGCERGRVRVGVTAPPAVGISRPDAIKSARVGRPGRHRAR